MGNLVDTSLKRFEYSGDYFVDKNSLLTLLYYDGEEHRELKIDKANVYADESWVVYSKDGSTLITCLKGEELTKYKVKVGTCVICDGAFRMCGKLKEIILPESVQVIGKGAFWGCSSLYGINLLCKVEILREKSFQYCSKLSYIMLPESLKRIEEEAFYGCGLLSFVFLAQNVEYIAPNAFEKNTVCPINIIVPNLTKEYYSKLFEGRRVEIQTIEEFNTYQKEFNEKTKRRKFENKKNLIWEVIFQLIIGGGVLVGVHFLIQFLISHSVSS